MELKYKCLVIDHDDTSVSSTPKIHYPAFIETMNRIRPALQKPTLEEFFIKNFEPGISKYLMDELQATKRELLIELGVWREFTSQNIPDFFPDFLEILSEFRKNGGIIVVASHSEKDLIERDYKKHSNFLPEVIFGWDNDENKRKPNPYPVNEILRIYNLDKKDVLVLDDLKPGLEMAKRSKVKFAAAGWGHQIPVIKEYMFNNSDFYFESVGEFRDFLFLD